MYVVFVEELDAGHEPQPEHIARTLDQAFAMIVCRCGYSYRFEPAQEQGWCLFLIDVERPALPGNSDAFMAAPQVIAASAKSGVPRRCARRNAARKGRCRDRPPRSLRIVAH